ncbi:coagulation factor X-like isoform X2 [Pelobates fuscus]|uniref:coagulation factor X-like isoform X2 n=1 Tax=Pelobates fuscus TaxID=191477 RepID=UPI002FE4E3C2
MADIQSMFLVILLLIHQTEQKEDNLCEPNPCRHGWPCKAGDGQYTCHRQVESLGANHGTDKYPCGKRKLNFSKTNKTTDESLMNPVQIVEGRDCKPNECPWQAVLLNNENEPFCGGTILSPQFILTAAQCINQTKDLKVAVGKLTLKVNEVNESIHRVDTFFSHRQFSRSSYDFDIAIIKLKDNITFTDNIIPACIPDPDFAKHVLSNEPQAMTSGFGRYQKGGIQVTNLQMLNVPYIDRQHCKNISRFAISRNMFCAGYEQKVNYICNGDSGGPHVTPFKDTYFVTGIVSWSEGCPQQGKPIVYTKVSNLNKWVTEIMKINQA